MRNESIEGLLNRIRFRLFPPLVSETNVINTLRKTMTKVPATGKLSRPGRLSKGRTVRVVTRQTPNLATTTTTTSLSLAVSARAAVDTGQKVAFSVTSLSAEVAGNPSVQASRKTLPPKQPQRKHHKRRKDNHWRQPLLSRRLPSTMSAMQLRYTSQLRPTTLLFRPNCGQNFYVICRNRAVMEEEENTAPFY